MKTQAPIHGLIELIPTIRQRRAEIEEARQLPADLAAALRRTGVFGMGVPRAIGGSEASPLEIMRAIEAVAAADGSAGWCTMIGVGNNITSGYVNERGAREVFADPAMPIAGIAAPSGKATRVDGGLRISGRWAFASGITHCDWVFAGCMVMENGQPRMTEQGPDILHVCIPVRDVEIHDTWYVSGLAGTGSHDFTANDVFVPEHRAFRLLDPTGHRSEPLYRMPPLTTFVAQVVCVGLGIARAALDELVEEAATKVPTMYTKPLAERPVAQIEVARAEARLGSARAFLFDTTDALWNTVLRGDTPSKRQLAIGRIAATNAAEASAEAARTASILGGGGAIYNASSLQRHARDADAVLHHFTVAQHTWEESGRVLLGLQPNTPVI